MTERIKTGYSIRVNTGDQHSVYRQIDEFFDRISEKLEPSPLQRPSEIEIKVEHLYDMITKTYADDTIHRLFYKGKVIAIVSESRDLANFVVFDFFDASNKI